MAENRQKRIKVIQEACEGEGHGQEPKDRKAYEDYDIEISEIMLKLKKLKYGRIEDTIVSKFAQCKEYAAQAKADIEREPLDVLDELKQYLKSYSPSEINGWVNNDEGFEVSFGGWALGDSVFDTKCKHVKERLKKRIEDLFDQNDADEKVWMEVIEEQIEKKYEEYSGKNREYYRECALCLMGSGIRSKLQMYWGGGGSYRESIAEEIWEELKRQSIEDRLQEKNYDMDYMEDISAFLNISGRM